MAAGRHIFGDGDANSNLPAERLVSAPDNDRVGRVGEILKPCGLLLLPVALAACASSDEVKSITFTDDRGVANQPFPNNYRAEILAFMKTYLNNPAGVREAAMADPVQRTIGGGCVMSLACALPPAKPTAPIASRGSGRCCLSTAGWIASSRTPASPARA